MKRMDLLCPSQASTAICSSMDQKSMVRQSSRAIDRHTAVLIDDRRKPKPPAVASYSPSNAESCHTKARKSCAKQKDMTTPSGSSRYLLSTDAAFFHVFSDFNPPPAPAKPSASRSFKAAELTVFRPPSPRPHQQVVVLKVSLHCKGCEGKVRKHISRMEGVKSFNIDFLKKKVTVVGEVSPAGVLESISKVKKAELWPSTIPSSSSSSSISSSSLLLLN